MDVLNKLIKDKASDLLGSLTGTGFTQQQAEAFLPEASNGVMDAIGNIGVDKLISMSGHDQLSALLDRIDVGALAAKTGLDAARVSNGLQSILPAVLGMFGGSRLGDMLGGLEKFF